MEYIKQHSKNIIAAFLILILCFVLYWINLSSYHFVDTDETKFVSIAKDLLNSGNVIHTTLNGKNFFDYPPLFFWIVNLFCFIFGKISSSIVRLPNVIALTSTIIFMYFVLKRILTKLYAIIILLIFSLSLSTLIFSHLATIDMLFLTLTINAILCAFLNIFARQGTNKDLFYTLMYIFIALGTMTVGLLGFIVPVISIVIMHVFSGKMKLLMSKKNLIKSSVIFSVLILPWHIIMISLYGKSFIKDYLSLYNFMHFVDFKQIGLVLLLFIIGFMPWSFSLICVLARKMKDNVNSILAYFKDNSEDKLKEKWKSLKLIDKVLSVNTILFFTTGIFALLYGSKHTYLLLLLTFPAAVMCGNYWYQYIVKKENVKSILFATLVPNIIFMFCSLASLFGHKIIHSVFMQGLHSFFIPLILIMFVIPLISIFAVILKGRWQVFLSHIILMFSLSFVIVPSAFNFVMTNGGEDDLIKFSALTHDDGSKLAAYIPSYKYSINYYYDNNVIFHRDTNINWLKEYLRTNPDGYVITEIKTLWDIEANKINYMLLDAGRRYCLIQHLGGELKKDEAEIIAY